MNLISQCLRRLQAGDPTHIWVLQQIEDEGHVQAMFRQTADGQPKSYAQVGAAASPRKSSQSTMRRRNITSVTY